MKKKMAIAVALIALFIFGSVCATAVKAAGNTNRQRKTIQMENEKGIRNQLRFWEQIRNRIRDMFGYCGDCGNMTEITGILEYDEGYFIVDSTELHFGPQRYITSTESPYDYDEDGQIEIIFEELQGLVGLEVTVEGHLQSDNWLSVFYINGELYREPGKPVWASRHNGGK